MSLFGFGIGLLFVTRGGGNWIGTIDSFVNEGTWGIMFVGLIECVVLGWVFDIAKLRRHANKNSDWQLGVWWQWAIRLVIPLILTGLFVWNLYDDFNRPEGFMVDTQGNLIGKDILGAALLLCVFLTAVFLAVWHPKKTS